MYHMRRRIQWVQSAGTLKRSMASDSSLEHALCATNLDGSLRTAIGRGVALEYAHAIRMRAARPKMRCKILPSKPAGLARTLKQHARASSTATVWHHTMRTLGRRIIRLFCFDGLGVTATSSSSFARPNLNAAMKLDAARAAVTPYSAIREGPHCAGQLLDVAAEGSVV
mmetsp:Transcript_7953/g.23525  ORF Transcript_7953/g.23525 Transcript_7953/m.23525 type:complete len:169 (-) Transcript_7953:74-580(-)